MIWNEELPASLDQSAGVIIFSRIELSRSQQLAQVLAERVANMLEQNEKTLDFRLGIVGGWNDRADGAKGDKRGEQTQERRGRGERSRGGTNPRGTLSTSRCYSPTNHSLGARGGRSARFAQGLGNQMPASQRMR
jgi:translation initiation factor 3 subunit C